MLSAENVLLLNGFVVIALVAYFLLIRRKSAAPVKLKLKNTQSTPAVDSNAVVLNIMFNFNGHSFDAFEALGLPAGSSASEVEAAYERQRQGADVSSREFFAAAYQAIVEKQSQE